MSEPVDPITGLRDYVEAIGDRGLLQTIRDADWEYELGAITEVGSELDDPQAILFDDIKDYPEGFRILTLPYVTDKHHAIGLNLDQEASSVELVEEWKNKMREMEEVPPTEVQTGPVKENVIEGDDVNVWDFPAPMWHADDGGRFIGTGNSFITKDPDSDWVNMGVYRNQVHDENTVGVVVNQIHHGWEHFEKYWERGEDAPVVIDQGPSTWVYAGACTPMPHGYSELELAGGLKGGPIEVIIEEDTGLPVPAHSEFAMIGRVPPPEEESHIEGPFGECFGYYAGDEEERTVVKVDKIWHRDDPIIKGCPELKEETHVHALGGHLVTSARAWNAIEDEIPNVKGVYSLYQPCQTGSSILVVSIDKKYTGHGKQAAAAAFSAQAAVTSNWMTVAVDEDIDPSDPKDVMFALTTRCSPEEDIDMIQNAPSFFLDPRVKPEDREVKEFTSTAMIVDATRPDFWDRQEYPKVVEFDDEYKQEIHEKWNMDEWG